MMIFLDATKTRNHHVSPFEGASEKENRGNTKTSSFLLSFEDEKSKSPTWNTQTTRFFFVDVW